MRRTFLVVTAFATLLAGLTSSSFGAARAENWTTLKNERFRGTPVDVIGPFAWFTTDKGGGKRVLLSHLSEADCVRFSKAIGDIEPRRPRWAEAVAPVTKAVFGNVKILLGKAYTNPDLGAMAEPEFLILIFGGYDTQRSWEAIREFIPEYNRLKAKHGDLIEALYLGVRNRETEQDRMAYDLDIPFFIEKHDRSGFLRELREYAPAKPPTLWVMARQGVPVAFSECKSQADIERACLEMETLIHMMRLNNARTWPDRLHYYRAVRRAAFASGRADPMLIGHPVDLEALKTAGVPSVVAELKISPAGQITSVAVQPTSGVTKELGTAVGQALLQAVFVPAVENGEFVEGTYELRLEP